MNHDEKNKETKGKPQLHLVPTQIIRDIAIIREYGNNKYPEGGPNNWKSVETKFYYDAAFRHLLAEIDNPGSVDTESGLPHLAHLACNVAFLCEMKGANNERSITLPLQRSSDRPDKDCGSTGDNRNFDPNWVTSDGRCSEHLTIR